MAFLFQIQLLPLALGMRHIVLICLNCLALTTIAQQVEIDSIKRVLPSQNSLDQVKSLNELSWYYRNFDLDSAILFARSALKIGENENSKAAISQSYNSLANVFNAKGLLDSALIFHTKAYQLKEELGDSLGMASSLNNLGIVYDELGNFSKSLEAYFQALRIYEAKSDQPYDIAMVLGNIGIVYKKQKEYDKVLEYYRRSLSIYEEVNSDFGVTVSNGNIGSVLLLTGDYNESINYSTIALDGYKKAGYTRYVPYMLSNIGVAHDSLGNTVKARVNYLEAEKGHKEHQNKLELTNTYLALASNYRRSGNYSKGIHYAENALSLSQELQAKDFEAKALKELAFNLASQGYHKRAFETIQLHSSLEDSLFEENKTKQIFELQTQYETEKKEQQLALQNALIAEQEAEINQSRTLLIAAILTSVLLILIGILVRARLKKKEQLKFQQSKLDLQEAQISAAITSQEKERARYARDLHDGFGQMISVLKMNLVKLAETKVEETTVNHSTELVDDMYGELKNICFDLMPQTLVSGGITPALNELVDRLNQSGKINFDLNSFDFEPRPTELIEQSIYRICQEWINNILKYSDASNVTVQLTSDENEITLLIEDDGQGFDQTLLENNNGNGWKNMNSRAKLIHGNLELDTRTGTQGSTLILNAPLRVRAQGKKKGVTNNMPIALTNGS